MQQARNRSQKSQSPIVGKSAWLTAGNVVYGLSQFILVAMFARTQAPSVVGAFTLALAIIAPVLMFLDMNLRIVIATDPMRRFQDFVYRAVRERTILLAVVVCLPIGAALGPTRESFALFVAVLLYKVADSLSNLSYGFAFRDDRGAEVGKAMILRGTYSAIVGSSTLILLPEPATAVLMIAGGWLATATREWHLFGPGLPNRVPTHLDRGVFTQVFRKGSFLGVDALASSLYLNIPRYHIQAAFGSRELGIYGALSTLANGLSIVAGSVANVLLPRLAALYELKEYKAFLVLLRRLVGAATVISIPIVGLTSLVGDDLARLILGSDYAQSPLIVALVVASCLNVIGEFMAKGLQAAQAFRAFLVVDLTALVVTAAVLIPATLALGTAGAAWAIATGGFARILVIRLSITRLMRRSPE